MHTPLKLLFDDVYVYFCFPCRRVDCAHKKGGGSTKNGRDSESKRLGVKLYGGQRYGHSNEICMGVGAHNGTKIVESSLL